MAPKDWVVIFSSIIGAFVTLGVLHAQFILPGVLVAAETRMEERIRAHAAHPHEDSVHRTEFQLVMQRLDSLATKESVEHMNSMLGVIQQSQGRLEDRMLELEKRVRSGGE